MAFDTGISSAIAQYVFTQTEGAVTEPIGGSYIQAYCEFLGIAAPLHNSWLIALCNHFGITAPVNASWTIALANYYGITSPTGGTWWMALAFAAPPVSAFIWDQVTTEWQLEDATWNIPVAPTASFDSDVTTAEVGNFVQFFDTSTGVPTSFNWTFQSGTPSTSTLQDPLIQFNETGQFAVSLEATNALGSDTVTIPDYLTVIEPPSIIPLTDIQFYFPFNGTAVDESGNENTTTQQSSVFAAGKFGLAANISSNETGTVLTQKVWNVGDAFSVAAWINPTSLSGLGQIITADGFGLPRLWQFRRDGDKVRFIRFDVFNANHQILSTTSILTNEFTHVAATFDTISGSKLYINGVENGTNGNLNLTPNVTSGVGIGRGPGLGDVFLGLIDEAILYSRALTAAEISTLAAGTGPLINP